MQQHFEYGSRRGMEPNYGRTSFPWPRWLLALKFGKLRPIAVCDDYELGPIEKWQR